MANIFNIVTKLFGSKYDKDIKSIKPIVQQIHEESKKLVSITNDELREKTTALKTKIEESICSEKKEVADLKSKAENEEDKDKKEEFYNKIDEIEKSIVDKTEITLNEILPEAFAVVKETATRFTNNETIRVKATEFDRDLSVNKDFVSIDGEHAIYKNTWIAAGNEIKWEMIHYDVQLIGGVVLHQGKISEMKTGEGKTLVATLPAYLNALEGKNIPVYGKGNQIRDWLYVEDHAKALYKVLEEGVIGETYNIGGNSERRNIDVVIQICELLDEMDPASRKRGIKSYKDLISYVEDRPGHDLRYALDITKIKKELGWQPEETFESGLVKTVKWNLSNRKWSEDRLNEANQEEISQKKFSIT